MGTEKSRKVGLSCRRAQRPHPANSRLCACPGRFCSRGAAPKGPRPPVLAPGWPLSVGVTGVPHHPCATSPPASIGRGSRGGSCMGRKAGTPVPPWLPEGCQGGRGRQPGQGPGGPGGPSWPCLAAAEGTTALGDPQEEEEGAARRAWGHSLAWHRSGTAGGSAMGTGRGAGRGRAACGRLWLGVCSLCPGQDGSGFRGVWAASPCSCMAAAPLMRPMGNLGRFEGCMATLGSLWSIHRRASAHQGKSV